MATALCAAALVAVHGSRIVDNWHITHWEDELFFQYNVAQIHSLGDCFAKEGAWNGLYRPLTTNLYYYLGGQVLGSRIEGYHVVNLVFVVLNAVLLFRLAELFLGTWLAMLPAVLFASRLAMVEVVLNTCEFQGLFYSFFTILSADLFIRSRKNSSTRLLVLSAVTFVLALLSKEAAVVLPAILIAYGRLFDDKPYSRPYWVHPIIAVTWAMLFALVLPAHNHSAGMTNDFSSFNLLRNYSAYALVFPNLLLMPLQSFVMPAAIAALAASLPVRAIFAALIVLEGAALLFPRFLKTDAKRLVVFGFAWFLIITVPYVIFANRLFMRYSYLGHAGLALCVGGLAESIGRVFSRRPRELTPEVFSLTNNKHSLRSD